MNNHLRIHQRHAYISETAEETEDRNQRDLLAAQQGYLYRRYNRNRVSETTEEAEIRRNHNFLAASLTNSDCQFLRQQFQSVTLHQFLKQGKRHSDRELFNRKELKKGFLRYKQAILNFNEGLQYKALVRFNKACAKWLATHQHHTSTERRNAFKRLHNKRINYIWTNWQGTEIPDEVVDQWLLDYRNYSY